MRGFSLLGEFIIGGSTVLFCDIMATTRINLSLFEPIQMFPRSIVNIVNKKLFYVDCCKCHGLTNSVHHNYPGLAQTYGCTLVL